MILPLLLACTSADGDPDPAATDTHGTATDTADTGADTGGNDTADSDTTADTADSTDTADTDPVEEPCIDRILRGNGFFHEPDYLSASAVINDDCSGTNHQDITGIEHVVFVGDSITVGTPPNTPARFYRVQLATWLATTYGLTAPDSDWNGYDIVAGVGKLQDSGDFSVCAKWGARTDDLKKDNNQIADCIPEAVAGKTTLIVITVGGNDLFSLAEDYYAAVPAADLRAAIEEAVTDLRDAITWVTTDKVRFPGKVYVVFANLYEFTDGFGDVDACPGADFVGIHYDLGAPIIAELIAFEQVEHLKIATETQTDMIFLGEAFCGHGYNLSRADGRCYRDADAELWFDASCFHPNNAGHDAIAGLFQSTIEQ